VVKAIWLSRKADSGGLQIIRRRFSGPSVGDNLIKDLLSLVEALHPSALDGADMHENILAAVIGLDEAKAFLAVEPLYGSLRHETLLSGTCLDSAAQSRSRFIVIEILERKSSVRRVARGEAVVRVSGFHKPAFHQRALSGDGFSFLLGPVGMLPTSISAQHTLGASLRS
jgi:hypothetical protein